MKMKSVRGRSRTNAIGSTSYKRNKTSDMNDVSAEVNPGQQITTNNIGSLRNVVHQKVHEDCNPAAAIQYVEKEDLFCSTNGHNNRKVKGVHESNIQSCYKTDTSKGFKNMVDRQGSHENGIGFQKNQVCNNVQYGIQQSFDEEVAESVIEHNNTPIPQMISRGNKCVSDDDDFEDLVAIGKQSVESMNHLIVDQLGEYDLHVEEKCSVDTQLDHSSDTVIATSSVVDAMKSLNPERNEHDGIESLRREFMGNKLDYTNVPDEDHGGKVANGSDKLVQGQNYGEQIDDMNRAYKTLSHFSELKLDPNCKKRRRVQIKLDECRSDNKNSTDELLLSIKEETRADQNVMGHNKDNRNSNRLFQLNDKELKVRQNPSTKGTKFTYVPTNKKFRIKVKQSAAISNDAAWQFSTRLSFLLFLCCCTCVITT